MADQTIVRFGGESVEQTAYKLLHDVARQERKLDSHGIKIAGADKKWILETYAECLQAARGTKSIF